LMWMSPLPWWTDTSRRGQFSLSVYMAGILLGVQTARAACG